MGIPVRITHSQKHRFLRAASVAVFADGTATPEAPGSVPGGRLFDVPTGTTRLVLKVRVEAPSLQSSPLLTLEQGFDVVLSPRPDLKETAWGPTRITTPNAGTRPGLDPRVVRHDLISTARGLSGKIELDLSFLDVTQGLAAKGFFRKYALSSHFGCRLLALEFTGGLPSTWLVVAPPALMPNHNRPGVLIFYRPTGNAYRVAEDEQLQAYFDNRILRYLTEPPPGSPFYIVGPAGRRSFDPIGNFGFERQLAGAARPVLFVHPIPPGGDFFAAEGQGGLLLLDRLVRCLWADGHIAQDHAGDVRIGRLALAGFSHGGEALFQTLAANTAAVGQAKRGGPPVKPVDELYAFDPNTFTPNRGLLERWFRTGGKKLRMLAGAFENATMFSLSRALASPDATVQPPNDDYWRDDPLYRASMQDPVTPELFTVATAPAAPAGSLSARTGLFFVNHDARGVALEGRWVDARGHDHRATRNVAGYAHAEAAAVVQFRTMPLGTVAFPLANEAALNKVVAELLHEDPRNNETLVRTARHEWPGMGGEDSAGATDRGATFKGFLQLALERSGFLRESRVIT